MVPVSASTSFLSCPSTRSTVGGSKVLFPLILRIFQFCHKYNCKYYHKYKSNKKRSNVVPGPPTFDWFFICSSYLTIKFLFMVTVTLRIQMQTRAHIQRSSAGGVVSIYPSNISMRWTAFCHLCNTIARVLSYVHCKMQSKVKGEVIRDFWQKNKQWRFPKRIHTMKDLCFKRWSI